MENNIYQKLQNVRVEVNKACTKKSGKNAYAGFEYFELKDFLPKANEIFAKQGLCPVFNIERKNEVVNGVEVGQEMAVLRIFENKDSYVEFTTPTADVVMGSKTPNPIQNLGAQHTYLKRYLYMNALELSENDIINSTSGKEEPKKAATLATLEQVNTIMEMYDSEDLKKIKDYYKVDNIEKLTVVQASQVIARKKKEQ